MSSTDHKLVPNQKRNKKSLSKGFSSNKQANARQIAIEHIGNRNWTQAIAALAQEEKPNSKAELKKKIDQIFNAALQAASSNQDTKSIALHCQLLALDPKNETGMRNFSVLLKRTGQYQAAHHFINKCLS